MDVLQARPGAPFLDEADHVYLAVSKPARQCIKLNLAASVLWRRIITEGLPEKDATEPVAGDLIAQLVTVDALTGLTWTSVADAVTDAREES
ncbi:hypothetical protein ACFXJ5_36715 [Streptomyces sp. NPDC059373]